MCSDQNLIKNILYQGNWELINYGIYEVDTLTEIIDTVRNSNSDVDLVKNHTLSCKYQISLQEIAMKIFPP